MTDLETACRELVEEFREQADKVADRSRGPIHRTDYARGVSAGLNHALKELERELEEHRDVDPEVKTVVGQMEDAT
jgi:hypothetical protein